uniref:Uncharacterized protein n=1 Tax=Meloidogyne enterolobii TaxID=390850 RepID=A0A6V7V9T8_MELEN|nr:unnamed protein product [Meloidogyne enterolobii]
MERYKFCFYILIFLFALFRLVESTPSPPHKSGNTQISEHSSSATIETSEGIFKPKILMRSSRIGNEGLAELDGNEMNSEKDSWENENISGESNYLSEDDDTNSEHNYFNYFSPLEKEDEQVKSKTSSSFKFSLKKRKISSFSNKHEEDEKHKEIKKEEILAHNSFKENENRKINDNEIKKSYILTSEEALQMIQDIYNIDHYNSNYSGQNSQNEETSEDNELNTQQETKPFNLEKFSNKNYGFSYYVKNNKSFEIKSTVELFKNDEWKIQKEEIPEHMDTNKHKEGKAWNHKMMDLAKEIDKKCFVKKDTYDQLCIRAHLFVFCITLNMYITEHKQEGDGNIATHFKWFEDSAKTIFVEKKYHKYNINLLVGEYFKYLNAPQESKNSGGHVEAHKNTKQINS